jgi:hypothetical protein
MKKREEFKDIVMTTLRISFDLKRPIYNMSGVAKTVIIAFNDVADRIVTQDLVQEFIANRLFSVKFG